MSRFALPENAPAGLDSPATTTIIKHLSRIQARVFRWTGGRLGGTWRIGAGFREPVPTLLLEHRGRKSGRLFTAPLLYLRRGEDLVIAASQGGLPSHPQWYFNLRAQPEARVHLKGHRDVPVTARTASGQEREQLWAELVALYADFAKYQAWTDREIPVVVLSPR